MPRKKSCDYESDSDSEMIGKALKKISPKKATKEFGKVLKHLTSHIADIEEPIDPKDFKQAKEMINNIKTLKGGRIIPKSDVIVGPSIGKGLLDNLDIKDFEKLDKLIEEFGFKKRDKLRNLLKISKGTTERVKKEVKALKKAKPDRRFTRKGGMIREDEEEKEDNEQEAEQEVEQDVGVEEDFDIYTEKVIPEGVEEFLEFTSEIIKKHPNSGFRALQGIYASELKEKPELLMLAIPYFEESAINKDDIISDGINKIKLDDLPEFLSRIVGTYLAENVQNMTDNLDKNISLKKNMTPERVNSVLSRFNPNAIPIDDEFWRGVFKKKMSGNGLRSNIVKLLNGKNIHRAPITTLPVKDLPSVKVGKGVRPKKGTKEAKEFMAKLRSMRKSKN